MRRIKKNMTCIIGLFSMVVLFTPLSQVSATQTIEPLVVTTEPTILDLDETNSLLPRQTRITTNTFYGGVTGIPGFGTVWGEFYPTQRRVTVYAEGRDRDTKTGGPHANVRATASRDFFGNKSGWWWA
ncbi:Uncharacterised protein [Enterococcus durans]|uniref:Uncharacterized protein n=1 Tax=Enterococcus durans TaxID=53345 RepID=A0A377KJJ8_9ENTE|nr:hypothetical protein [Enterococcus durans]STP28932.1 Uncharacterised protein [Enterococcus durans]